MKSEERPGLQPLFLAGPTASGKSAAALELAARTGGEIVNADAFQLYRGLDILTAKPARQDLSRLPHHLFSILDPAEPSNAAQFEALARPVIGQILERGVLPIVVGGSGLYLKALTHGLSPLPPGDPTLRAVLAEMTADERTRQLLSLDPQASDAIDLANPRYVTRALEICILSGRRASDLQSEWASREVAFRGAALHWDRDVLYDRINRRAVAMLNSGAIEEVRALTADRAGINPLSHTAGKAIGLREIRSYLDGVFTLDETIFEIQKATRHYAKRQITWFKREKGFAPISLKPGDDASSVADSILSLFPDLIP